MSSPKHTYTYSRAGIGDVIPLVPEGRPYFVQVEVPSGWTASYWYADDALASAHDPSAWLNWAGVGVPPLDEGLLRLQRWSEAASWWFPATTSLIEAAPHPIPATRSDLGRCGIDLQRKTVWAVVSAVGEFSIGISSGAQPPAATPTDNPQAAAPSAPPDILGTSLPMCGVLGASMICPLMLLGVMSARRRRARG